MATPASLEMLHNLPPFVHSIFNGLCHGSSSSGDMNSDMNKLLVMLREARIAKEEEERKEIEREHKEIEHDKEESEEQSEDTLPVVTTNADPLTALEIKLKQFVTDQLTLLEERLETKLNNLIKRLDNLESINK